METFLLADVNKFLQDNHTCPQLAHILLDTLHCEIKGTIPASQHRHGVRQPKFQALLQAQTDLGWSQLFQGRLANDQSRLQEDSLATNNAELKLDRRYYTGAIWTRKLISLLWTAMRAQWELRNDDRHGRTKAANYAIRHERLLKSIDEMYADAPEMLATDRAILLEPPPKQHKNNPSHLELWLKRTRAIVSQSKVDGRAEISRTHDHSKIFSSSAERRSPPH
jgi:hypothetical protein